MRWIVLCVSLLLFIRPAGIYAQIRSVSHNLGNDYYPITLDAGFTSFYGDIDEGPAKGKTLKNNWAIQLSVARNFKSIFETGIRIAKGRLSGQKIRTTGSNISNRYFKADYIEYSFDGYVNLLVFFIRKTNTRFVVYGKVGLGLIDFKTELFDGTNDSLVQSYGYGNQKSTTEMVVPLGIKVMYHLSPSSAISIQSTFSKVDTDKLDGVTGNHNSDYYNYLSIGYTYKINPPKTGQRLFGGKGGKSKKNGYK